MATDQLDLLSPLKKGRARRAAALEGHDAHKGEAIRWLRKKVAELYQLRVRTADPSAGRPHVSADDAREIYAASSFPPAYSANRTFFGSIFRGADWEIVGRTQSRHPANNAREIKTWKYIPEERNDD